MKIFRLFSCVICTFLAVLLLSPTFAKADGGIFYPDDYWAYETSQRAFIYFADKTETLVISARYSGNAKDFSWVVPLPAKPEIDKSSNILFNTLSKITQVTDRFVTGSSFDFGLSAAPESSSVEVISEKTIDAYDTAVLKASNEKALSVWLKSHGYSYPADQESALKSYVDNGWYFAVAKIQPALVSDAKTNTSLSTGTMTPLQFTFQTDKIIYPMKLTGIALRAVKPAISGKPTTELPPGAQPEIVSNGIPVSLYVVSNSRVQQSSLTVDWANWLTKDNIEAININLGEKKISAGKLFMTELSAVFLPEKINDDLIIVPSTDNQVYPTPEYKTSDFWLTNIILLVATILIATLSLPGLIFIVFVVLQRFASKNKVVYIFGSIYQILFCLALISLWLVLYLTTGNSSFFLEDGSAGTTLGLLLVLTVAIFFVTKMLIRLRLTQNNGDHASACWRTS